MHQFSQHVFVLVLLSKQLLKFFDFLMSFF